LTIKIKRLFCYHVHCQIKRRGSRHQSKKSKKKVSVASDSEDSNTDISISEDETEADDADAQDDGADGLDEIVKILRHAKDDTGEFYLYVRFGSSERADTFDCKDPVGLKPVLTDAEALVIEYARQKGPKAMKEAIAHALDKDIKDLFPISNKTPRKKTVAPKPSVELLDPSDFVCTVDHDAVDPGDFRTIELPAYAGRSGLLFTLQCHGCEIDFSDKRGPGMYVPTCKTPVYVCTNAYTRDGCKVSFCKGCYFKRLSPSTKRSTRNHGMYGNPFVYCCLFHQPNVSETYFVVF